MTLRASALFANPRWAAMLILFVSAIGALAYTQLARQEDPSMTERWANIQTFLPGATAERMESLISEPIEKALREIPEINEISSVSRTGYSIVNVQMYDSVTKERTDTLWAEVRDKLSDVHNDMPAGTTVPALQINKPLASTLVLALRWEAETAMQIGILSRLADALSVQLANLPGTEETEVYGEAEEEVLIALDPHALAASGLTADDVARSVRSADTKTTAGRFRQTSTDMLVEVDAELASTERIRRIPLARQGNGEVLRLSAIADVRRQQKDPPTTMALWGDERVVMVSAKMQAGLNIDTWMQSAQKAVTKFAADLPSGVTMTELYNQNRHTRTRMGELGINLLTALSIVMLTLVWFMGVRAAITVGIALPLSGAMVLGCLHFFDIPLHQMSVTGLIISLGLLIDNAIVVVEDYKLRRRAGLPITAAIDRAVGHLFVPLGASTATTALAFMPIALAPGGVGDFTGTVGLSVIFAVVSSFVLAMTVVPVLAGFFEIRWPTREGYAWWQNGFSSERLTRRYRATLRAVLRRPALGIAVACVLPLIGFALFPTLTKQFFPPVDRDQFQIQINLPPHSSIWQTRQAVATADAVIRGYDEVVSTHWSVGEGAPRTFYNAVALNDGVQSFAGGWVDTTSAEATAEVLSTLQDQLTNALPHAEVLAIPFEQGPPLDAPIQLRVIGPELNELRLQGERLRAILSEIPEVTFTRATLSVAEPKLVFTPREYATNAAGLNTGDLPGLLNAALIGVDAGTVQEGNANLTVRVRVGNSASDDLHDLAALPIVDGRGSNVPMQQIGDWHLAPSAASIDRFQGERVSNVLAYLQPFTLPDTVMAKLQEKLAENDISLPPGYRLDIGGSAEERDESVSAIASTFAVCALLMAVFITLSLNSFRLSLLIAVVGGLSFGLALFGVRLFGYPFGYMALIGALGMVGLAINGAIIVLSALRADPQAARGDIDRVEDVVVDATRHIVSTTATTIGGFTPLIVAGGTFWPPLATAIAGGVAGSAIIALYFVPAVFVALGRRRQSSSDTYEDPMVTDLHTRRPAA